MKTYNADETQPVEPSDDGNNKKRLNSNNVTILLALMVPVLFLNGCAINWQKEWRETNWSKDRSYSSGQNGMASRQQFALLYPDGSSHTNDKLATKTTLSAEGLKIMNEQGCFGCHQGDGSLSISALSGRLLSVAPHDETISKTLFNVVALQD